MQLTKVQGMAISDDGQRLYVADTLHNSIVVVDFANHTMRYLAPDDPFADPFGVALDAQENVYVALPRGKMVMAFSKDGKKLRSFGWGEIDRPTALAVDRKREILYVADSSHTGSDRHRVLVYSLEGKLLRTIGGVGDIEGRFLFPVFLALDVEGNLYVADTLNFRIQQFDPEGRFVRAFGEQGDVPGTFNLLKGIAFDGFGNLYAVDGKSAIVQIFNRDFDLLMWFGGFAPKFEYLELPVSIAIDQRRNRIYVGEQGAYGRVNVYDLVNTRAEDSIKPRDVDLRITPEELEQIKKKDMERRRQK
jgi:sugar lactone lactonase YvrE